MRASFGFLLSFIVLTVIAGCSSETTSSLLQKMELNNETVINPNYFLGEKFSSAKLIAGSDGVILQNEGSCNRWQVAHTAFTQSIFAITESANKKILLAVGEKGLIAKKNKNNEWRAVTTGVNSTLRTLAFSPKSNNWYAGGDDGVILKSQDATNWQEIKLSSSGDIKQIYYLESEAALVAIGSQGLVYFSYDEGDTWEKVNLSGRADFNSVLLIGSTIFIASSDGSIWRKEPNVDEWSKKIISSNSININAIAYSADHKKIVATTSDGEIFLSDDLGLQWAPVYSGENPINKLVYIAEKKLWIAAADSGVLLMSKDGGNIWSQHKIHSNINFEVVLNLQDCLLAAGSHGGVVASWDDGETWSVIKDPINGFIQNMQSLANDGLIYAVGSEGLLMHSEDAGKHWQNPHRSHFSSDYFFASVIDYKANIILAGGPPGTLVRSTDGGKSWQPTLVLNDYSLGYFHKLVQGDAEEVMAIAGPGLNYFSENNGLTWYPIEENVDRPQLFAGIYSKAYGRFVLVGDAGNIRLYNSSTGWKVIDLHVAERLQSIAEVGGRIFVASVKGSIYVSDDGGETWMENISLHNVSILHLKYFERGKLLLATGARGAIYRSANEGATWKKILSPIQTNLREPVVARDGRIFIPSRSGEILVSKDRGESFAVFAKPTSMSLRGIYLDEKSRSLLAYGERLVRLSF